MPPPAVGWPMFLTLGVIYFSMGYLLLGSIFLTIGAMAATVREVQTLSMPVTMLQLLVFFFASYAMAKPGSAVELAAAIFPLSSPFAMLARAAQIEDLWPHALAILWQVFAVAVFIKVGATLFRKRVMKSGTEGAAKETPVLATRACGPLKSPPPRNKFRPNANISRKSPLTIDIRVSKRRIARCDCCARRGRDARREMMATKAADTPEMHSATAPVYRTRPTAVEALDAHLKDHPEDLPVTYAGLGRQPQRHLRENRWQPIFAEMRARLRSTLPEVRSAITGMSPAQGDPAYRGAARIVQSIAGRHGGITILDRKNDMVRRTSDSNCPCSSRWTGPSTRASAALSRPHSRRPR